MTDLYGYRGAVERLCGGRWIYDGDISEWCETYASSAESAARNIVYRYVRDVLGYSDGCDSVVAAARRYRLVSRPIKKDAHASEDRDGCKGCILESCAEDDKRYIKPVFEQLRLF